MLLIIDNISVNFICFIDYIKHKEEILNVYQYLYQ